MWLRGEHSWKLDLPDRHLSNQAKEVEDIMPVKSLSGRS